MSRRTRPATGWPTLVPRRGEQALAGALFDSAEGARVHSRLMILGTNESDVPVQPWEMLR
ncbi:MAG: hypothetical protein GY953_29365, partial [bacterium]|nr:hypothetical protein [bacterium]